MRDFGKLITCIFCGEGQIFRYVYSKNGSKALKKGRCVKCKSNECSQISKKRLNAENPKIIENRFLEKIDKTLGYGPNGDCWKWLGSLSPTGYGQFTILGKITKTHRYSYELFKGKIDPLESFVCHTCDIRNCVNPEHLYLGTNRTNMRDMSNRNRGFFNKNSQGIKNFNCKLTEEQVLEIRRLYATEKYYKKELGAMFSITASMVSAIILRRSWTHI